MIASSGKGPFGIAALKMDSGSHRATLTSFACPKASKELVKVFLQHIISEAQERDAISINSWVWSSEEQTLDALSDLGFKIDFEHSLISRDISHLTETTHQPQMTIQSLSEGVTIPDFVTANREAFKDDPSEPLQESELEEWLSEGKGFRPDLQLAAVLDGSIVGTTMCETFEVVCSTGTEQHAWIHGLGVAEPYRRRGIATDLVTDLMSRLQEHHVRTLWLFTDTEGPIREFYDRLGFLQRANFIDLTLHLKPEL